MKTLQWKGAMPTRVRESENGEKFDVLPSEVFVCDETMAKQYLASGMFVEVVEANDDVQRQTAPEFSTEDPAPKKRGRKPKVEVESE